MGTYQAFGRNESREQEGVIVDLGESGKFRLARAGGSNKRYQKSLESGMRPHRRAFQQGTLSDEVANAVLLNAFCDAVVLGWEGVTGPDGQPLPYSRDAAKKLLTDLPDLFTILRDAAADVSIFRDEVGKANDQGN